MKKRYIIISILISIALLALASFLYFWQSNNGKVIMAINGEKITMNNIKELNETKADTTFSFKENNLYSLNYYPETKSFIISIASPNISLARSQAENDFLNTLNITKEDACKLSVSVGVPYSVSPDASGINYGLSFCPGGRPLE